MELLEFFKTQLLSEKKKVSPITLKNYLSDIRHFIQWFERTTGRTISPTDISEDTIQLYRQTQGGAIKYGVIQEGISLRSINRHISSIRKLSSMLVREKVIEADPFQIQNTETKIQTDLWHIQDFKDYLYVFGSSHLTIKNYINDIQNFARWFETAILPTLENPLTKQANFYHINQEVLDSYKKRLLDIQGAAPRTINRKLSSLRRYLEFATKQNLISPQEIILSSVEAKLEAVEPTIALSDIKTKAVNEPVSIKYSKFAPLRLLQKTIVLPYLLFEEKVAAGIALMITGKKALNTLPLSLAQKTMNAKKVLEFQRKLKLHDLLGIRNINKEFYAPQAIQIQGYPFHKRIWHHMRHTRPDWYKKYHTYTFSHYLHFAILIVFASGVGIALYQNLVGNRDILPSFAAPVAPPRVLSFQGRLTDNLDNPITTSTNIRFAIYNDASASGAALLWEEVLSSVTPDQDGIFSVILGNGTAIPSTVFSDNINTWLGVTIASTPELTPRQRIATVAYATNSEFLQGLPPITGTAATTNVVLALDASGNLTIGGSAAPTFTASGGQFKLSGQPLVLATNSSSGGNIILIPDGLGKIDLEKPLINLGTTGNISRGAVEVDDKFAILASESAVAAFIVNNQSAGGDIFTASQGGTTKFIIDTNGNVGIGKRPSFTLDVAGTASISSTLSLGPSIQSDAGACALSSAGKMYYDGPANTYYYCNGTTWTQMGSGSGGSNFFRISQGALSPVNDTLDLLIGGVSTSTAKIAFTGINTGGTPTASFSGNLSLQVPTGSNPSALFNVLNGGSLNFQTASTGQGDSGLASRFFIANDGRIGINTSSPFTKVALDVRGLTGTTGTASISARSSFASLLVDNAGVGDIFVASQAGRTVLRIDNNGNLIVGANGGGKITADVVDPYLVQNQKTSGITSLTFQTMGASNADFIYQNVSTELSRLTQAGQFQLPITGSTGGIVLGGDAQIFRGAANRVDVASGDSLNLVSGSVLVGGTPVIDSGGNATFTTLNVTSGCTGCTPGQPSPFQVLSGAIVPINSTNDFLLGAQASPSAKFAVLNIINGTPTASVSSGLSGTSAFLTAGGNLATQNLQNLTLGGSTTGNISINSGNDVVDFLDPLIKISATNPVIDTTAATTLSLNTVTNRPITTGTGLLTAGGNLTVNGATTTLASTAITLTGASPIIDLSHASTLSINTTTNRPIITGTGLLTAGGNLTVAGATTTFSNAAPVLTSGTNTDLTITANGSGDLILTGDADTSVLIGTNANTQASLSVSGGIGSNAGLIVNRVGATDDIIAASSAGVTRFVVKNDGTASTSGSFVIDAAGNLQTTRNQTLTIGGSSTGDIVISPRNGSGFITLPSLTGQNGVHYGVSGTGVIAQATTSTSNLCLLSGASNPIWGSCSTNSTPSPFQLSQGAIVPTNSTVDFLVGAQASPSAKFAILNISNGIPTASVSSGLSGTSAFLTAGGNLATQNMQSLILGGTTTGNLQIASPITQLTGSSPIIDTTTASTLSINTTTNRPITTGTGLTTLGGNLTVNGATTSLASTAINLTGSSPIIDATTGTLNVNITTNRPITTGTGLTTLGGNLTVSGATTLIASTAITLSGASPIIDLSHASTLSINTTTNRPITTGTGLTTLGGDLTISGANITLGNAAPILTTTGNVNLTITPAGAGDLILTSDADTPVLIGSSTNTPAPLSVTGGFGSNAGFIINRVGLNNDIIAASSAGITRFLVKNDGTASSSAGFTVDGAGNIQSTQGQTLTIGAGTSGNIVLGQAGKVITFTGYTGQNGIHYGVNGTGTLAQATTATPNQCLLSGASNPTWGDCTTGITNDLYWSQTQGALYSNNSTVDFFLGGQATQSAKFSVLNLNGTATPVASVSATTGGNATKGIYLSGDGSIQTVRNNTLTIGGNTTGVTYLASQVVQFTGANTTLDTGVAGTFNLNTITNRPITTGTGQLTAGGNLSVNGSTTALASTVINLTGNSPTIDLTHASTLSINTTTNRPITTGTGLLTAGGNFTVNGATTTLASTSISLTGASPILNLTHASTLSINTTTNRPITTGTGLLTAGGDLTVAGATTTFSNAAAVLTTGTNLPLTITPNGSGKLILTSDADTGIYVGTSTNTPSALSVSGGIGSNAGFIVNRVGTTDDIFAASSAGTTRFVVKNDGTASTSGNLVMDGTGSLLTTKNQTLTIGGNSTGNVIINPQGQARLGIGTTSPLTLLHVTGTQGNNAAVIFNQGNATSDIFTASSSGTTRFTIAANGNINASTATAVNFSGAVLTVASCVGCGGGGSGSNWRLGSGALSPINDTLDLLVGSNASASAKFSVLNINGSTTPFASVSATLASGGNGNGISIGGDGTLQTVRNNTLVLGGATTGDIWFKPANNLGSLFLTSGGKVNIGTNRAQNGSIFGGKLNVFSLDAGPVASFSGRTSYAALVIDQASESGNLIAASRSGQNVFTVFNDGTVDVGPAATGKLNAGTVDPPYTIDGQGYATYMPSMVGVKEEYAGKVVLGYDNSVGGYAYKLDFNNFEYQSGHWVFNRIIDPDISQVSVLLSPNSQAKTWYKKDGANRTITLFADRPVEISYRLTAPRFDHDKWKTYTGVIKGHIAPPPTMNGSSANDNNIGADPYYNTLTINRESGQWVLKDVNNNNVNQMEAFGKVFVAQIKSGLVNTRELITDTFQASTASIGNLTASVANFGNATASSLNISTDSVTIAGISLRNYINQTVTELLASGNFTSPVATADQIRTNVISPTGNNGTIALNIESNNIKLKNTNTNKVVAQINDNGDASFSGTLSSEVALFESASVSGNLASGSLTTTDATISGTLYANNIDGLDSRIANQLQNQQQASLSGNLASGNVQSLHIGNLTADYGIFEQGIVALGPATFTSLTAMEQISIGDSFVIGDNAINTLGADLEIQPLRQGGVNFLAGLVKIDTNGNMDISGNLNVLGNIAAQNGVFNGILSTQNVATELISPLATDSDISLKFQNSKFNVQDSRTGSGSSVLSINNKGDVVSSGSGTFAKLNFNLVGQAHATSDLEATATGSAGFATLKKNKPELTIYNPNVTEDSLIYITPFGDTQNKVLYLLRQTPESEFEAGSFTVGVSGPVVNKDIQFNYLIVN